MIHTTMNQFTPKSSDFDKKCNALLDILSHLGAVIFLVKKLAEFSHHIYFVQFLRLTVEEETSSKLPFYDPS